MNNLRLPACQNVGMVQMIAKSRGSVGKQKIDRINEMVERHIRSVLSVIFKPMCCEKKYILA